eukprot:COSAG02_NODE_9046_length_2351_cov_1.401421_2_plen_180_part_00
MVDATFGGAGEGFSASVGLFQAPSLTAAHRVIGVASILGHCFVVAHVITIAVTLVVAGFTWPLGAFLLDIAGFLAGAFFANECRKSSSAPSSNRVKENRYIVFFCIVTIGSRTVDTLMLLGAIRWGDVYETPTGAILWVNVVSEICFGNMFTLFAFVGAVMLLKCPKDVHAGDARLLDN